MAGINATSGSTPSTRLLMWTLLVVYIFNFLDRQIVNILAHDISRDLNLSDTQIGLMTGLAFAVFYTFLGIPIARYADRPHTNRARLITISLGFWSLTMYDGATFQFVANPELPQEHPPYDVWCTADGDYLFLKGQVAGYMQSHYELVELSRGPHWGN
mgnify:CR=1 FL=1